MKLEKFIENLNEKQLKIKIRTGHVYSEMIGKLKKIY